MLSMSGMRASPRAMDILCAILLEAENLELPPGPGVSPDMKVQWSATVADLQRVFAKLKEKYKGACDKVFEEFVFSDRGPEPFSPVLADSFLLLAASGFIKGNQGMQNPDYFVLTDSARNFAENQLALTKAEWKQVKRVASGLVESHGSKVFRGLARP